MIGKLELIFYPCKIRVLFLILYASSDHWRCKDGTQETLQFKEIRGSCQIKTLHQHTPVKDGHLTVCINSKVNHKLLLLPTSENSKTYIGMCQCLLIY